MTIIADFLLTFFFCLLIPLVVLYLYQRFILNKQTPITRLVNWIINIFSELPQQARLWIIGTVSVVLLFSCLLAFLGNSSTAISEDEAIATQIVINYTQWYLSATPSTTPVPSITPLPTESHTATLTPIPTRTATSTPPHTYTPIPPSATAYIFPVMPAAAPTNAANSSPCDPSYPDVCLPSDQGDYDCAGGKGNGPHYVDGPIRVLPPDPFGLDGDKDGVGCE